MPVYHSQYNTKEYSFLGNVPVLSFSTSSSSSTSSTSTSILTLDTSTSILTLDTQTNTSTSTNPNEPTDIIEESLLLLKPNTFFKNFEVKGGGDLLLIYLILYQLECLVKLQKVHNL